MVAPIGGRGEGEEPPKHKTTQLTHLTPLTHRTGTSHGERRDEKEEKREKIMDELAKNRMGHKMGVVSGNTDPSMKEEMNKLKDPVIKEKVIDSKCETRAVGRRDQGSQGDGDRVSPLHPLRRLMQ